MSHRSRRRIIVALLLISLGGITWQLLPRDTSLLDRAQKIIALSPNDNTYYWVSEHELLTENNPNDNTAHLTFRDLRTGQKTVPDAMNRLFKQNPHNEGVLPSPNGQWVMLLPFDGEADLRLIRRDGKEVTWNVSGNTHVAWLADGQAWIEIPTQLELDKNDNTEQNDMRKWIEVHSLQHPKQAKRLPLVPPLAVEYADALRVYEDTLFVLRYSEDSPALHPAGIVAYHIGASELRQIAAYPLPFHDKDNFFTLSPDGRRLAWRTQHEYHNPTLAWLHRFLPAIPVPSARHIEFWTSNLDGSHKREVGHYYEQDSPDMEELESLQWLADSKRLSFIFYHALYSVPAD